MYNTTCSKHLRHSDLSPLIPKTIVFYSTGLERGQSYLRPLHWNDALQSACSQKQLKAAEAVSREGKILLRWQRRYVISRSSFQLGFFNLLTFTAYLVM